MKSPRNPRNDAKEHLMRIRELEQAFQNMQNVDAGQQKRIAELEATIKKYEWDFSKYVHKQTDDYNKLFSEKEGLEAAVNHYQKECERLSLLAQGKVRESLMLKSAGPTEKGFGIDLQSEFMPMMTNMLACWFEQQGGINYVECKVCHEKLGPLVLSLQKCEGKTPHELRKEAEAEVARLRTMTCAECNNKPCDYCNTVRELREKLAKSEESARERLQRVVQEHECLREENERLNLMLEGKIRESLKLCSAGPSDKGFEINLQSEFMPMMANMLVKWFKQSGGINYVECRVQSDEMGQMVLNLQRCDGKTPHEIREELEAEVARLRDDIENHGCMRDQRDGLIQSQQLLQQENARLREENERLEKNNKDAERTNEFLSKRLSLLQRVQKKMREPERTIVCDIIANGCLLTGPDADKRYSLKAEAQGPMPGLTMKMLNSLMWDIRRVVGNAHGFSDSSVDAIKIITDYIVSRDAELARRSAQKKEG